MSHADNPIGVTDSGLGGLTVVRELQRILPGEDIIYFGDTANCPYGNKSRAQLLQLSGRMLSLFSERHAKCAAIACNTTSALVNELRPRFSFPIITIAECAVHEILQKHLQRVGLIATVFTANNGLYDALLRARDPSITLVSEGSPKLAELVERGDFSHKELDAEIRQHVNPILAAGGISTIILGCTHYPIVLDRFSNCYPNVQFIDPAPAQAQAIQVYLTSQNAMNPQKLGRFTICTTGDPSVYVRVCENMGIRAPDKFEVFPALSCCDTKPN